MKLTVLRTLVLVAFAAAVALPSAAFSDVIELKITPHNVECHIEGDAVRCTGKYSGLGNNATTITVTADFTCTNKAGNTVQGQSGGSSGPITPENGQVTFDVSTTQNSTKCTHADGHTVCFGPTATIEIFQNNTSLFKDVVTISNFDPTCQP